MKLTQSEIEKDWHSRGFSCSLWTDPPGACWEDYVHDVDELLMVLEGEVEFEMKNKKSILPIGKEILIPAKVVHCVRNIGKTTSKWLYGYKYN